MDENAKRVNAIMKRPIFEDAFMDGDPRMHPMTATIWLWFPEEMGDVYPVLQELENNKDFQTEYLKIKNEILNKAFGELLNKHLSDEFKQQCETARANRCARLAAERAAKNTDSEI